MGRHSAPAPTPGPPDAARPPTSRDNTADDADTEADHDTDTDAAGTGLVGRAVLALTAGLSTVLATSWAGLPWRYAALAGVAAAVVVMVSAWIAGTMPERPTPYSDARDSDHTRE